MANSLSAIILAGGQSTRMGQDKALILLQGMPLLCRTCNVALECTPLVYVVTPRTEVYAPLLPAECQMVHEQLLENNLTTQGPLVGFAQGLAVVDTEWVLLLACDLPYLQADLLQNWMLQLATVDPAIAALLPRSKPGWEPLCGFYRPTCLPRLTEFIQADGRSFQQWLAQETVQAIAFSPLASIRTREEQMLFNCNTPADLEKISNP
jgi:molybdopterin-guanine dinucleotide biosynthesis protein A